MRILIDTSIWIDHLRRSDTRLEALLRRKQAFAHPFVIGEIALGPMRDYDFVIQSFLKLPQAAVAPEGEVLSLIRQNGLMGSGIGYVDAHLLASATLAPGMSLWTRDRRLHAAADRLSLAYAP
ncbi:MAG: PIN domain-containing protein [Rhizobium sp.]|nr:PIN domain-containing protein [Rhizobium sp.]